MKTNRITARLAVLWMVATLISPGFAVPQTRYDGPLIETHAHIVHYQSDLGQLKYRVDAIGGGTDGTTAAEYVDNLDRNNIKCTVGFHAIAIDDDVTEDELRQHAETLLGLYPDRFILFAEIFRNNPLTWFDATKLEPLLAEGLYSGFGEIEFANSPLSDDTTTPETILVYPNDERFMQIYTVLGGRGLFVMAHPASREFLNTAISALPGLTWIIHGPQVHGRWDTTDADGDGIPDEMEELENLLDSNPNLYYTVDFFESLADIIALKQAGSATAFLDYMNANYNDLLQQMVDTWKDVIERHPDRFMWGTDMANHSWQWSSPEVIDMVAQFSRDFIGSLEASAGQMYAYQNAESVFGKCDEQGGQIQFSAASSGVDEGVGSATITVERTGRTARAVSVDYATSNGTATEGSDYLAATGTLTFGPGETTKTFTVSVVDDSSVEDNETINLTLSNPTRGATLGSQATAVLTIANNDVEFRFKEASYSLSEGAGTATIRVEKLGGTPSTVTVDYATSDGTAIGDFQPDYVPTQRTLTFSPGDPGIKTFTVTILNDTTEESDETVNLTLSNPMNPGGSASLATPSSAVLTILNDDFINTPSGTNVLVDLTPVSVTFANVTQSGITSLTTSTEGASEPLGFELGDPPTYYEIITTAVYSGSVTVCINYSGVRFKDETNLLLFHLEGGVWVDRTVSLDTTNKIICASVSSFSSFAIFEPIPIPVAIDIKPGSFPNSINLGSGGTVPVAIMSSAGFDAGTVDPTTVTLASAPVQLKGKGTPMASLQDVNGDGLLDLVVHVSTEALQLNDTDTAAVLRGRTSNGRVVKGTDSVRVVP